MARKAKALGALEVSRLSEPGLHAVGTVPGLRLCIKESGAASWVLRKVVGVKRCDIGLGSYPAITLAMAHAKAREVLTEIAAGKNPVAERRAGRKLVTWTFEACALAYIETFSPGWKNAKHAQQWRNTLATYVFPVFGAKHVRDVDTADIVAAIRPHWNTKNETVKRVRGRIELILSWAAAQGLRPKGFNPATWKGHLDQVLPRPSKVNNRQSFEAMPIDAMHDFMLQLRATDGMGARCLEFAILCACRSGEARGARWSEIDLKNAVWSIPGERMKAGRQHRVPLSDAALALLKRLPRLIDREGNDVDLVFPGLSMDKPVSDMTLTAVMRRKGLSAVPHGFRSTFCDWVAERTAYPAEVREMALAHAIASGTEAAYRRGDLFDKRRRLMADWAAFLDTAPAAGNVVALRKT